MLQNLTPEALETLFDVSNNIWTTGNFPTAWKQIIIQPIPNPDKPRDQVKGYRSIALVSCVAKTFERMLKTRLEVILEKEKKIPQYLTGFRKGYSTMDNSTQLIADIQTTYS
jgi:ribonuclease HII